MAERTLFTKVREGLRLETIGFHPRLHSASALLRVLPGPMENAMRISMLRKVGFSLGEEVEIWELPRITGGEKYRENWIVKDRCIIEVGCMLDLQERITMHEGVRLGHQSVILTSTHELGPGNHRAGPINYQPVTIGAGCWIGARSLILPGVSIGEGSVIAAGSVVNKDVEPHSRMSGTPARFIEKLES